MFGNSEIQASSSKAGDGQLDRYLSLMIHIVGCGRHSAELNRTWYPEINCSFLLDKNAGDKVTFSYILLRNKSSKQTTCPPVFGLKIVYIMMSSAFGFRSVFCFISAKISRDIPDFSFHCSFSEQKKSSYRIFTCSHETDFRAMQMEKLQTFPFFSMPLPLSPLASSLCTADCTMNSTFPLGLGSTNAAMSPLHPGAQHTGWTYLWQQWQWIQSFPPICLQKYQKIQHVWGTGIQMKLFFFPS